MAIAENRKRDFIAQILQVISLSQQRLIDAGFDPSDTLRELEQKYKKAVEDAGAKAEAMAAYKNALHTSRGSLKEAYSQASSYADILTGLLGKDDSLVREIRKIRKE